MTEGELIARAREGEADAIQTLYRRYAGRVHSVIRRIAGEDALAEDWAQEAWVNALRALPRFRGEARFSTWLHRVAVNSALQGRRREARARDRDHLARLSGAREVKSPRPLLRLELQRALDRLPDGMRRVLVLHDVEGYTHEEIGGLLGVAAGTSKSQLFKARAKMRELLRPAPELEVIEGEAACHT